jgi:putative hydrolase of the HAD superfamily
VSRAAVKDLALITDYGGVLTNPLAETLDTFCATVGLSVEQIATAMARVTEEQGIAPMAQLEVAEITEQEMVDRLSEALSDAGARLPERANFGELWFAGRRPNTRFVSYLTGLRGEGYRVALLTNNVREWSERWRATIPVDALFEVVVASCDVRVRKPDPRIYELMLERLGLPASRCVFVDDVEENCVVAERLGMHTVHFISTHEAIAQIEATLGVLSASEPAVR